MKCINTLGLVCLAITAVGCGGWEDDQSWGPGVWSPDRGQAAFVLDRHESRANPWSFGGTKQRRNHRLQVYIGQAQNDAALRPLGPIVAGDRIFERSLHFYPAQGYVLLQYTEELEAAEGPSGTSRVRYHADRIGLDGRVESVETAEGPLMLSCDGGASATSVPGAVEVLPSPDGSVLAVIHTQISCETSSRQIRFLRAADSGLLSGPFELPPVADRTAGKGNVAWTPDGEVLLGQWSFGGTSGVRVSRDGTLVSFSGLAHECYYPATGSDVGDDAGNGLGVDGRARVVVESGLWSSGELGCAGL